MTQSILIVYLLLLSLLFSVFTLETFQDPKTWFTILAASALAPWAVKPRRLTRLDLAVVLSLFSAVISTIYSVSPNLSLVGDPKGPMGLVTTASLTVIYLAAVISFETLEERRALWMLLVLGSVPVAAYAMIQSALLDPLTWRDTLNEFGILRPISTLGHPITLGSYLVLLYPFALYFTFRNAAFGIVLAFIVPAIFLTQSRGPWIAMAVQTGALVAGSWKREGRRLAAIVALSWFGVALMLGALTLLFSPGLGASIAKRFLIIVRPGGSRAFYWWAAVQVYLKHPWLGIGTDCFRHAFEHLRTREYWGFEWAGTVGKAHNDFLNTLATQGAVGGAAFIYLGLTIVKAARARIADSEDRAFALTVFASIVGYYVQNMSAFPTVTTGAIFMTAIACLHPEKKEEPRMIAIHRAAFAAIVVAGALFAYNFAAKPFKASSCAAAAIRSKADAGTMLRMLDYAATLEPRNPAYPDLIGQVADQIGAWDLAARGYARAAEVDPEDARYVFKLGTLTGDVQKIALAQLMEPANPVFDQVRKQMQLNKSD